MKTIYLITSVLTNGFQVEKVQKLLAVNSDAGSRKMSITLSWVFSVFEYCYFLIFFNIAINSEMTASLKQIVSFPIRATLISNNNTVRWETFILIKYSLRASYL